MLFFLFCILFCLFVFCNLGTLQYVMLFCFVVFLFVCSLESRHCAVCNDWHDKLPFPNVAHYFRRRDSKMTSYGRQQRGMTVTP